MHFQHTFWLQSICCLSLINTIPPMNVMVGWYCKVHTKSHHPNWCIKVVRSPARHWDPFLWIGFNCLKTTKPLQKKFTFYHSIPRTSWYSFSWPRKDERVSWPWSHSAVLNLGLLNWESRTLTTWALLV